jgi:hypothetical protein
MMMSKKNPAPAQRRTFSGDLLDTCTGTGVTGSGEDGEATGTPHLPQKEASSAIADPHF